VYEEVVNGRRECLELVGQVRRDKAMLPVIRNLEGSGGSSARRERVNTVNNTIPRLGLCHGVTHSCAAATPGLPLRGGSAPADGPEHAERPTPRMRVAPVSGELAGKTIGERIQIIRERTGKSHPIVAGAGRALSGVADDREEPAAAPPGHADAAR
jgi:hypothetical protein